MRLCTGFMLFKKKNGVACCAQNALKHGGYLRNAHPVLRPPYLCVCVFLSNRVYRCERDEAVWLTVVEPSITLRNPITPYRSHVLASKQEHECVCRGVAALIADAQGLAVALGAACGRALLRPALPHRQVHVHGMVGHCARCHCCCCSLRCRFDLFIC